MLAAALVAVALADRPNDTACNSHGGGKAVNWQADPALKARAYGRTPEKTPRVTLNLDLDPKERWREPLKRFPDLPEILNGYLKSQIPAWAVELIETVLGPLDKYKGWGDEYTAELDGIAEILNTTRGTLVTVNLLYVIEGIGVNCSNWNDTGPTGECKNQSDVFYPFVKKGANVDGPPGACTSIVAADASGKVVHGRNFDWNLPDTLRPLIWEVDFQKGGKTLWTGTSIASYIGIQNGMKPGDNGFAVTMDARCQGGKLLENVLEMLLQGGLTPSLVARSSMQEASSYKEFNSLLETKPLIAPIFYITSGGGDNEGAVITRERTHAADVWPIDVTETNGWWRLETNYDHWMPVPDADNRREPGNNRIQALGRANITEDSMYSVMTRWPTFNPHTDHTVVFVVRDGVYNAHVWRGD